MVGLIGTTLVFLSTPSARRATEHHFDFLPGNLISIHALLEEGDGTRWHRNAVCLISIHALREEGDALRSIGKKK